MATARDIIFAGVLLFALGLGFFIVHNIMTTSVDKIIAVKEINESSRATESFEGIKTMVNRLDYVIMAVFIGLILSMIITGWFIGGNPIFMFIYFIVILIAVIISTFLANIWETATQSAIFGSTISSFPITNNILLKLPIYIAVIGVLAMVVMFAKPYIIQNEEY